MVLFNIDIYKNDNKAILFNNVLYYLGKAY